MCGINGFISSRIAPQDVSSRIADMNHSIRHRGPDDTGVFTTDFGGFQLAFGQDRLSIIDLSLAGHQPMFYDKNAGASNDRFETGKIFDLAIVFNGEIYNYQEVRAELESLGYTFSTHSDTEVILASYDAWGTACVHKWNGMWAFALYDIVHQQIFCSRDRFGKKPFYFYHSDTDFVFSSELKGILEHKELAINTLDNIDKDALDFYFTTGNIPAPKTIYKNVEKLEAGTNLILKVVDGKLQVKKERYYTIDSYVPIDDKQSLIEEGKSLLADAVKIRMFSADVPVGAFLSGGLDSSSVVAEMTKHIERSKLHTFSIGFAGKYDETPYIDIVKEAFGTNHHHSYFRESDFIELLDMIPFHYDEPYADYSNFPTTYVSRLARQDVTVALSGDGGDEVFGGYMMHQVAAQMDVLYRLPVCIRRFFARYIPQTSNNLSLLSKLKEAFRVSIFPKEDFYAELGGSTLYRPQVYKDWTREKLRYLLEKNNGNFIQSIIDFDLYYNTLADNFLVKVDRASMSQALEVRSPLLDYRLIEYARKIPTRWKVSLTKTKILMRDIIRDIVPASIVHRGKKGFEPPIRDWILDEVYQVEMKEGLEALYGEKLISTEWYNFYKEAVFSGNNTVYNVFKIKLFLLIRWKKRWIAE